MSDFVDSSIPSAPAEPTSQPITPDSATLSPPAGQPAISPAPTAPGSIVPGSNEATVPSYRLREMREQFQAQWQQAQNEWDQRETAYQAQLEQIQRQLHALVGIQPSDTPEVDAIRQQFNQMFPRLAQLEERADQLLGLTERAEDVELQSRHYWQSYGRQSMDHLCSLAEKTLGTSLTPEARRNLHAAFTGYVSSSPELVYRYTNDPTLVGEFWQNFSSALIDPVRRSATATVQQTVPGRTLPQDTPSGAVPMGTPAPKPANIDERVANAWASYQTHKGNR